MKRYRIIEIDSNVVLEDGMSLPEAQEVIMMYCDPYGSQYKLGLEIEEYIYIPPEGKRLGRDPDLH